MNNAEVMEWDPLSIIMFPSSSTKPFAIFVLDTTIELEKKILLPLWSAASVRIGVDGGTNRLYTWQISHGISADEIPPPDYIIGDLDSVHDNVLRHYTSFSNVIDILDQSETDFTKSLIELDTICEKKAIEIEHVVVIGDSSGRLDHIMANINTLFKGQELYPNRNVYILGNESLSWLLGKGMHSIIVPACLCSKSEWCGLIPIGGMCKCANTTGLRWNLENSKMKFGELVSTSNTYSDELVSISNTFADKPCVTVNTSDPLLWCMSIYGLREKST